MKNEKCKIVYTIKLFTFIFCIWKRIYLLENIVWENVVYIITNQAKFFSNVGYLKRSHERPTSIKICIGLVDVVL